MRPHEPGRTSGRAPRPQGAAVGRTAASAAGAFAAQGWTGGRAWPLPGRLRMPAWSALFCADLAGLLIMKSGPRQQCRLCRQAKAELRPQGPFPQIITSRPRRRMWGGMTRARRGNAVLTHSCANLKGHFARNGYKRDLRVVKGKGSFWPGKRFQEPPAPVVWRRKPGELSAAWLSRGPWLG